MVKFIAAAVAAFLLFVGLAGAASAQTAGNTEINTLKLPDISGFAAPKGVKPLATGGSRIVLTARLAEDSPVLKAGLVWRVFGEVPGPDGKLPLLATAQGGSTEFDLPQGTYLIHAAFGRAGATKRITAGIDGHEENLVLDAGGIKLNAVLTGGKKIPPADLRFSVYDGREDESGNRALIIPDVPANSIVRLNAGTYHVVSNYGDVNASIRADIVVEAGKLTEAVMEHAAARVTLKLVRVAGGEALADTSWAVLTGSGDIVREQVGAYSSMVLAEGAYTVIAKNRDQLYQRDFVVVSGEDQDVEVVTSALSATPVAPAREDAAATVE